MKRTTISELKHDTSTVLEWVAQGETVEVMRRDRLVAVLCPPSRRPDPVRPDFGGRLRAIYGETILSDTGSQIVCDGRGET